jgi:hypothetical protein
VAPDVGEMHVMSDRNYLIDAARTSEHGVI